MHSSCAQSILPQEGFRDGLSYLVAELIGFGPRWFRPDVRLHFRLRQSLREFIMILFAAIVTVLLFIYLLTALLRPEWF